MLDYEGYDYESEVEANRLRGKLRDQEKKLMDWETRLAKVETYHHQMIATHEKRISELECKLRTMKAKLKLSNAKIKNLEAKIASYDQNDDYYGHNNDDNDEDTCGVVTQETETSYMDAAGISVVGTVMQGKSDSGESAKENFSDEPAKKRRKSSRISNRAIQDSTMCTKDAEVEFQEYVHEPTYFDKASARPRDHDESSYGQYEGEDEMTLSEDSSPRSYNGFSAGESNWEKNPTGEIKQKQAAVDEKISENGRSEESHMQEREQSDHEPEDEEFGVKNEVEDCDVENDDEDSDAENEDEDCDFENYDEVWNVETENEQCDSESLEAEPEVYECPKCSDLFHEYDQICRHITMFHNNHNAVPTEQKQPAVYKCGSCDAVFKKKKRLQRHEKSHAVEELIPSSSEQVSNAAVSIVNTESELMTSTEAPIVLDEIPTAGADSSAQDETRAKEADPGVPNETFVKEEDLSVRDETPAKEEVFECCSCFKRFPHSYRLKAHNDGTKQFHCRGCAATFTCRDGLRAHVAKCDLYGGQRCDLCGLVLSDLRILKRHVLRVHPKKKSPKANKKCPRCPKICYSANSYREHLKMCNQKCVTCKEVFTTPSNLAKHIHNVHPMHHDDTKRTKGGRRKLPTKRPQSQSPKEKASAEKPKKVAKTSQSTPAIVSVNLDTLKDIPECSTCGKTFASNSSLQRHIQSHEKGYVCLLCKAESGSWSDFEKHVDSTHPESKGTEKRLAPLARGRPSIKKFICSQCFMEVSSKESLLKHFVIQHAWLKPFKCEKCEASFTSTERLKKHESQHT